MKTVIAINSKKYKYHSFMAEDIKRIIKENMYKIADINCGSNQKVLSDNENCEISIMDFDADILGHIRFARLSEQAMDLLITFDCTMFDVLTSGNTLALNSLKCKCMHIIFGKSDMFSRELSFRQNCSMFTYVREQENLSFLRERFSGVANLYNFCNVDYKTDSDEKRSENRQAMERLMTEIIDKHCEL